MSVTDKENTFQVNYNW